MMAWPMGRVCVAMALERGGIFAALSSPAWWASCTRPARTPVTRIAAPVVSSGA